METLFWISLGILIYIFAGYPALIFLVSKIKKQNTKNTLSDRLPTVTMIIAAYNEERVIREKIENTLSLDYPRDRLQVVVFSDESGDATDSIVKSYASAGIELKRIEGRKGKTHCQNECVRHATGDVVVFSDANSMYDPSAIKKMVMHFSDAKIGGVVGELRYIKNGSSDEGIYWKIEQFLKRGESAIDSCLGANGSIYAVRRHLYVPLADDAISDFIEPFKIYEQGYRIVYEPTAFCLESVGVNSTEFSRKKRIIARTFASLKYIKAFLNPFNYGWYSFTLWSHKIIRWFPLVVMAVLFVANVFLLKNTLFLSIFILQLLFYTCAIIGIFSNKKPFSIPYLFMIMHIAAIVGVRDALIGKRITIWKTLR